MMRWERDTAQDSRIASGTGSRLEIALGGTKSPCAWAADGRREDTVNRWPFKQPAP